MRLKSGGERGVGSFVGAGSRHFQAMVPKRQYDRRVGAIEAEPKAETKQ